jgi:1,4-alpha-glucan branching enzyme
VISAPPPAQSIGSLSIVLHTHLPWVAHHGAWPVGEEWLHQAWSHSYLPIIDLLADLAEQGQRDVLSIGITPVLAAQLDDPYCLSAQATWLASWQIRAVGLAGMREEHRRAAGRREYAAATRALTRFETQWKHGGSPALRRLADSGAVEILGGPLAHAFTPDLDDTWATASLASGLDDSALRIGHRPTGIWTPECAYRPGLEQSYTAAGVQHLMLEGPTLQSAGAHLDAPWLLGDTDIGVVGRDLPLAYRVWSPRRGYPGGRWYRDFHTFDHEWGFRIHRVTAKDVPPERKAPYDVDRAAAAISRDARNFVTSVRAHLLEAGERTRNPLAVVAYDTELFGHWWHEGPAWLAEVLRLLPEAGIAPRSLRSAMRAHEPAGRIHPGDGSWGSGKDFRVWHGEDTRDVRAAQARTLGLVNAALDDHPSLTRDPRLDQIVTSTLLALASDWVFMIQKDSAADYARARVHAHLADVERLLRGRGGHTGDDSAAALTHIARRDNPWGHVDARAFVRG